MCDFKLDFPSDLFRVKPSRKAERKPINDVELLACALPMDEEDVGLQQCLVVNVFLVTTPSYSLHLS